jgi:hypothetical protein
MKGEKGGVGERGEGERARKERTNQQLIKIKYE